MEPPASRDAPLRIVQIIPELAAGGAERTTLDISDAIVKANGASLVISHGGRLETQISHSQEQFVRLPVHSKNPITAWQNISRIAALCQTFDAQIIHARSRACAWSAYFAAKRLKLPFVTTYHGTYNSASPLKTKYNSIMAKGDLVIANSNFIANHIQQQHYTDPARIRVIPRGLDLDVFDPATISDRQKTNLEFWPDTTPWPLIVMPGRLTRWKGQLLMVEALHLLKTRKINARLLLPGDAQGRDAYVREIQEKITALGLSKQVHLPGHISDMAALYAKADIVVSASLEPEAFGRVAVEAQAMGTPVIASAHGGSLETVTPGAGAILVPPGSPTAMADALGNILDLPVPVRNKWAKAAQAGVTQQFSKQKMCDATLAVYQELSSQKR